MNPNLKLPGDVLLYHRNDLVDWVIEEKTWSDVAHVEVFIGDGQSIASRNGIGVNQCPLRLDGLRYILRPKEPFNLSLAMVWFETVKGEGYDWRGVLGFAKLVDAGQPHHLFCSACATLFLKAGGIEAINNLYPACRVAPATLLTSPALRWEWRATD